MSSSAIIAAKKRLETYLKKYEIPTVESVDSTNTEESCKSGVLLLSLLQSRLNWTNSVFPRYKADPIQQPKRASNSRKKWPNMKYLGTGHLELGPHLFEQTTFYEATRSISWKAIAKNQGLNVPPEQDPDTVMTEATEEQKPTEKEEQVKNEEPVDEDEQLKFADIVFELNEVPNERFVFPKEALISLSVEEGPIVVHASFLLPVNPTDYFFELPKVQILKFGKSCQLPYIQEFIQSNAADEEEKSDTDTTYHPTNIQITEVDQVTIDALEDAVHKPDDVKKSMSIKMNSVPKTKKFVKYNLSQDPENNAEVQDLLKRSLTVPEITTGPIMAEKKRNEILNAIKLGKRPRDEKFESELPKNKYSNSNSKDDGLLKCAYCSTKHTAMWRPGPAGHGTLCNGCGLQWKRGEILKDAPVISLQEERKLIKEKKEKEKLAEALELEKVEKETKKTSSKKNADRSSQDIVDASSKKFAAQLLSQRKQQNKPATTSNNISNSSNPASKKTSAASSPEPTTTTSAPVTEGTPEKKRITAKASRAKAAAASSTVDQAQTTQATEVKPTKNQVQFAAAKTAPKQEQQPAQAQKTTMPTQQPQAQPQQQQQTPQHNPFMLYSQGGIPLPTLFIDFVGLAKYSHPNCAVTLLDSHFHIRLCSPETGDELCLINLEKIDLAAAQFEISQEGGGESSATTANAAIAIRELLTMTIPPIPNKPIDIFTKSFNNAPITIRFLEKLDPTGGAVVKRILQRWLVTVPQPTQPSS